MTIPNNISNLNFGALTVLLASGAAIAAFWAQVKQFLGKVRELFICKVAIKGEAVKPLMTYINKNGRRSPFGMRVLGGIKNYVKPNNRIEIVGYETISSDPMLLFFNKRPILIAKKDGGKNNSSHDNEITQTGISATYYEDCIFIWYLRFTFNIEKFYIKILEDYNNAHHVNRNNDSDKRFQVIKATKYRNKYDQPWDGSEDNGLDNKILNLIRKDSVKLLNWDKNDLSEARNKSPFDDYPFPDHIMEILLEIKTWKNSEKWYKDRGIPWKRGYLLYGPPGTGKSTCIKSIAQELDIPIYRFDLLSENNQTFPENYKTAQMDYPSIILMEDIDLCFNKKNNLNIGMNPKESLSFDCLLNTISGVGNSDGILLFITTNNIESIDSTLYTIADGKSSRPGRIDKAIFLGAMREPERRKLANLILSDFSENIESIIKLGENETAAQFQDRCCALALKLFWQNKK